MKNIEDLKLSRDMKYEALYWAIGFISNKEYIYKKTIGNINIAVNLLEQKAYFRDKLSTKILF